MGPWSETRPRARAGANVRPEAWLILLAIVLALFGFAILWMNRYEVIQVGGLPVRLDRLTGEVVACVPRQACFAIIPAGEPALGAAPAPPAAQAPPSPAQTPAANTEVKPKS